MTKIIEFVFLLGITETESATSISIVNECIIKITPCEWRWLRSIVNWNLFLSTVKRCASVKIITYVKHSIDFKKVSKRKNHFHLFSSEKENV